MVGLIKTENGFYIGDEVELPDGRVGCIDEILPIRVNVSSDLDPDTYVDCSVVRLDDEYWLDHQLTRR